MKISYVTRKEHCNRKANLTNVPSSWRTILIFPKGIGWYCFCIVVVVAVFVIVIIFQYSLSSSVWLLNINEHSVFWTRAIYIYIYIYIYITIFKLRSGIDIFHIPCQIDFRGLPQGLTDGYQNWSTKWLGVVRQQAITWANVEQALWRHMASQGHNGLKFLSRISFLGPILAILSYEHLTNCN